MNFFLLLNTNKINVGNRTVDGLSLNGKIYYRSQWGPSTVWKPTFFKYICKETHTDLELVSE